MEVYVAEKNQRIEERLLALLAGRFALSAFGANPFEHVGGSVEMKVVGESYFRDGDVAQTVGALADFAVEVCVVVRQSDMAAFVAAAVLFAGAVSGGRGCRLCRWHYVCCAGRDLVRRSFD